MSCLGGMVVLVCAPLIFQPSFRRALPSPHGRRWLSDMRRAWPAAWRGEFSIRRGWSPVMVITEPASTLAVCKELMSLDVVVFSVVHALEACGGSVFPFTCCSSCSSSFSSSQCRRWRRRSGSNPAWLRWVGLMLVVLLMRIVGPRRRCPVIGNRSYLRWRAVPPAIRGNGSLRRPMTAT